MEEIIFFDKEITLFLNGFYSPAKDLFFYLSTSKLLWVPFFLSLVWMIFRRQGGKGLVTLVFVGLIILLADQITSSIMKPLFERLRPSHDDVLQYLVHTVNGYHGGLYGFASSHASNTFALLTFFVLVVRRCSLSLALTCWTLINCYGRIYQGVHFVGDILVGALIGILIGRIFYEIYLHVVLHFFVIKHHNKWTLKAGLSESFGKSEPHVVSYTFWITVVFVLIFIYTTNGYNGIAY